MFLRILLIALSGGLLLSCDRGSNEDESPWPVWILYIHGKNHVTGQPVADCVSVIWRIQGDSEDQTTTCEDTDSDDPSFVKVWKPIREPLTVIYHVACDGYYDSAEQSAYFDPELAYTRPGAPGDEDIENVTISLYPE